MNEWTLKMSIYMMESKPATHDTWNSLELTSNRNRSNLVAGQGRKDVWRLLIVRFLGSFR